MSLLLKVKLGFCASQPTLLDVANISEPLHMDSLCPECFLILTDQKMLTHPSRPNESITNLFLKVDGF